MAGVPQQKRRTGTRPQDRSLLSLARVDHIRRDPWRPSERRPRPRRSPPRRRRQLTLRLRQLPLPLPTLRSSSRRARAEVRRQCRNCEKNEGGWAFSGASLNDVSYAKPPWRSRCRIRPLRSVQDSRCEARVTPQGQEHHGRHQSGQGTLPVAKKRKRQRGVARSQASSKLTSPLSHRSPARAASRSGWAKRRCFRSWCVRRP